MLSPMLPLKSSVAALLLVSGAVASTKPSADFWRAMEPKRNSNLRANEKERLARFYKNLAAKAKPTGARKLDGEEEDQFGFDVTEYSIKYNGCASVETYSDELADDRDGDTVLQTKRFAIFRMCPTNYCNKYSTNGCESNYGEYMLELGEYLEAINQFQEERMEDVCGYCAYCMQAVDAQQQNNDAGNQAYQGYADVEAQGYGDDGGYRERDLAYGDDQYQDNGDNEYQDNADNAYEDANDDGLACEHYDECKDYYDECVSWYQSKAMEYDNFAECVRVDYGDDDGVEYYLGPHCSDGYTVTMGVYSDEWCSDYIGDEVSFQEATGMQVDATVSFMGQQCVSCSGNEEDQFWLGWEEDQDENNNNNNNNNYYDDEEVLEICRELYEQSAKCHQNMDAGDDDGYQGYASANQQANEAIVCEYISSLMGGNYNENGEIVVDSSLHFPAFNFSDWQNKQQYIDEFSYVKEQSKKVNPGLIVGLVLSICGCLVMWIWACCLHAQLANSNMPWRPRRGKYTDPTALSRQNSGIVMGRSRSGTTPLI